MRRKEITSRAKLCCCALSLFFGISLLTTTTTNAVTIDSFSEPFWAILDDLMTNYWPEEDNGDWLYDTPTEPGGCGHYDAFEFGTAFLYQLAHDPGLADPLYTYRANRTVEFSTERLSLGHLIQILLEGEYPDEEYSAFSALYYGHRYYSGQSPYPFDTTVVLITYLLGQVIKEGIQLMGANEYESPAVMAYYDLIAAYTFRDKGSSVTAGLLAQQAYDMLQLADTYWIQITEDLGYYYDPSGPNTIFHLADILWALARAYKSSGDPSYLDRALDLLNYLEDYWDATPPYGYWRLDREVPYKQVYLNCYMVQALLTLYDATEDQAWLVRAQQTLTFLTSTQVFIEDIRFPGFSILGSGWYEWYGTNYCSCPGCNFAVLAAILMYNRLEQEGPSGIDLIPICPINTSTLGTSMASKVEVIRQFRDAYLLPRQSGEAFINAYYKYSPPIASYIAPREWLKAVVRIVLLPVIGFVWLFV